MGRVLLIRHGETEMNRQRLLQGSKMDSPLSEKGRAQVAALAARLAGTPVDAVFVSPLGRALETATILQRDGALPAATAVGELREMDYGQLTGQPYSAMGNALQGVEAAWGRGETSKQFPGGEGPDDAVRRLRVFEMKLRSEAKTKTIAVVAHGHINQVLLSMLLKQPLGPLVAQPAANASVTTVEL